MSVLLAKNAPADQDLSGLPNPSVPCGAAHSRAALLLHGFTGTPYELTSVAEPLAAKGFCVEAPALPGHAGRPWDLAKVRYGHLLDAVRQRYRALRDRYDEVVVVGLSMGGVLARALWREPRPPTRTVLMAPPYRIEEVHGRWLLPLVRFFGFPRTAFVWYKDDGVSLCDEQTRGEETSYMWAPLGAVAELNALLRWTRHHYTASPNPALVVWGRLDSTVPEHGVRAVTAEAGAAARLLKLAHSAHVLPRDVERAALGALIADYCDGVAAEALALPPDAEWLI